ncbi:hypothetical protein ECG_07266 [Echinococcus granulosus]|uniref:Uncharacterized protein n=1 Tax=Echinococcus granulosus TaxID=6210 RepID=A0A068WW57_ECHGR|nr:hypothetical protein ECG_07266 [Echinococcus granulosus]CDS21935.1 hypothetical protein EgrG_002022800 [Echinococcus granulosus]
MSLSCVEWKYPRHFDPEVCDNHSSDDPHHFTLSTECGRQTNCCTIAYTASSVLCNVMQLSFIELIDHQDHATHFYCFFL